MKRIAMDRSRPLAGQAGRGHNRWHPDIPPVLSVEPGEAVVLETKDALDGQVGPETTLAQLKEVARTVAHPLTGPVHVEGAEPGDLLAVHIEAIEPEPFGFTSNSPAIGFLGDLFPEPGLLRWHIADGYATSPDLPGVRVRGAPFMGVMGLAPSHELMRRARTREDDLIARGGAGAPPTPDHAVPAQEPFASEGLRTGPPREQGGNVDIKQLTAGTTVYLPVFVPGALFSAGDAHFAQGDGEVCGTAIEMGATVTVRFGIEKGAGRERRDLAFERTEYFMPPELAVPKRFYATTGLCIDSDGRNASGDITLAARNALLNMVEHISTRYGLTRMQAYLLSSVVVDLRISQAVDLPNVLVSALLPLDVFED